LSLSEGEEAIPVQAVGERKKRRNFHPAERAAPRNRWVEILLSDRRKKPPYRVKRGNFSLFGKRG